MNSLTVGAAIAICVAGWPLYSLVTTGSLDATSAMLRGGIVAGGCAFGVSLLVNMALGFEREAEAARTHKLTSLFNSMEGAVSEGLLVDPDRTTPPRAPDPNGAAGAAPGRPAPGQDAATGPT